MKINNSKLFIKHYNATTYSDLSVYLNELNGDGNDFYLLSTHYVYLGYKKIVNQIFIEMAIANSVSNAMTVEQYNGSSWVELKKIDETQGLKKSGFVYFDEDTNNSQKTTIDGTEAVWYRLKFSSNHSSTSRIRGINLVFNNEQDMKKYEPSIANYYPKNFSSHINSILAAREEILSRINNSDKKVYYYPDVYSNEFSVDASLFTQFDLFNVDELRECSTLLAIYNWYLNRSDANGGDIYGEKAKEYLNRFERAFKLWAGKSLSLDRNGDGKEDNFERQQSIKSLEIWR
jgi:hypothetical protein